MSIIGSYANGFAPRDGQPIFPELWRGCIGSWAMCLGPTGAILRDWAGTQNGTITGGPTWSSSQGRTSLLWAGAGAVTLATNYGHGGTGNPFSWSFWFRKTAGTSQQIVARFDGSSLFQIHVSSTGSQGLRVAAGTSSFASVQSAASTTAGVWYHGGFSYSAAGLGTLYLNGDAVGTISPNSFTSSTALNFGRRGGDSAEIFNGDLDDLRVYRRELTPFEFKLLAVRRGIAYDRELRRRSRIFTGGFKAYWAARKALIQLAGSN